MKQIKQYKLNKDLDDYLPAGLVFTRVGASSTFRATDPNNGKTIEVSESSLSDPVYTEYFSPIEVVVDK